MFIKGKKWIVRHSLIVMPDTEAEEYIWNTIVPLCKDKVICKLGALCGVSYNEYLISQEDYKRLHKEISKLKGAD